MWVARTERDRERARDVMWVARKERKGGRSVPQHVVDRGFWGRVPPPGFGAHSVDDVHGAQKLRHLVGGAATPACTKWSVVVPKPILAGLNFESCCLAERIDFWQHRPSLWRAAQGQSRSESTWKVKEVGFG